MPGAGDRPRRYAASVIVRVLTAIVPAESSGQLHVLMREQLPILREYDGLVYVKLARRLIGPQEEIILFEEWRDTAAMYEWTGTRYQPGAAASRRRVTDHRPADHPLRGARHRPAHAAGNGLAPGPPVTRWPATAVTYGSQRSGSAREPGSASSLPGRLVRAIDSRRPGGRRPGTFPRRASASAEVRSSIRRPSRHRLRSRGPPSRHHRPRRRYASRRDKDVTVPVPATGKAPGGGATTEHDRGRGRSIRLVTGSVISASGAHRLSPIVQRGGEVGRGKEGSRGGQSSRRAGDRRCSIAWRLDRGVDPARGSRPSFLMTYGPVARPGTGTSRFIEQA